MLKLDHKMKIFSEYEDQDCFFWWRGVWGGRVIWILCGFFLFLGKVFGFVGADFYRIQVSDLWVSMSVLPSLSDVVETLLI